MFILINAESVKEEKIDEESVSASDSNESMNDSGPKFCSVTPRLLKHFRCGSHTLNLLASTDFSKIINFSSQNLQDIHKRSFKR